MRLIFREEIMKKLWQFLLCVVLALTLAVGFAACGGDSDGDENGGENTNQGNNGDEGEGGDTKIALTVPQNVKVEGNSLVWSAVENASGYTVKINSDETTSVTAVTLDLTTVTAKLVEGSNTLAVKANGTGNYKDSAYSSTVPYVYTAPSTTSDAVKAFVEKVNAIGTLAQTNTQAEAAEISTAISEAEAAYEALSAEDKTAAAAAKALLDEKKQAYTTQMAGATTAHNSFTAYLVAAEEEVTKEESATALAEAIEAVTDAKEELSTLALGLVTSEETGRIDTLESTLDSWEAAIAAAVTKLSGTLTTLDPEDDATAETVLTEVAAMLDGYDAYKGYVKGDSAVTAKYTALNTALTAAQNQIKATVDALKADIDEALTSKTEATLDNYNALTALQTRADALTGAYAAELFGDGDAELNAAIEDMLKVAVKTDKYESVLYNNNNSEKPSVQLVLIYRNILGQKVQLKSDPTVTASETLTGGQKTEITSTIQYVEDTQSYNVKIEFTRLNMGEDEERVAQVAYKIGTENEVTLNLARPSGILYFSNQTSEAYPDHGNFTVYGATGSQETLVDVYLDEDIEKGQGNANVVLKGIPLVSGGTSKTLQTEDLLRHALAKAGVLGDVTVHLLAYQRWEESGNLRISAINSASVSAAVELVDIKAEEARERLPQLGTGTVVRDDGSVLAVMSGDWLTQLGALFQKDTFERADAAEYVRFHVYVTLDGDTTDFYAPMPEGGDTAVTASIMKLNIYNHFKSPEATGYTVKVCLALAEGSEFADSLRESYPVERDWKHTATAEDTKLQPNLTDGKWDLGDPNGSINYKWELVTSDADLHDGALIKIYSTKGIADVEAHDFSSETPFAVYTIKSFAYVSWKTKNADNLALDDVIRLAFAEMLRENDVALEDVEYNYSFVFAIQLVPNEAAAALGYTASNLVYATKDDKRDVKEYTFTESDIKATNAAQVQFAEDVMYLEFLRKPGVGQAFSKYGAAYVELEIKNASGQKETAYILLTDELNAEGKQTLVLSKTTDGTGETLSLGVFDNSYCGKSEFNKWVNSVFGWTEYDVNDTACSMRTKLHVSEESEYLYDGDWSEDVKAPQA